MAATQAAIQNGIGNIKMKDSNHEALFPLIQKFCDKNTGIEKDLLNFSRKIKSDYAYSSLEGVVNKMKDDKKCTSH